HGVATMSDPPDLPDGGNPPPAELTGSGPGSTLDGEGTQAGPNRNAAAAGWVNGLPSQLPCPLGRYELPRELGRGGMGVVFLGRDTQLGRHVAVKVPFFTGPAADELRERFFREARAAALVEHPNICPIHDVGVIDGVHFLTMAFVEGQPLNKLI